MSKQTLDFVPLPLQEPQEQAQEQDQREEAIQNLCQSVQTLLSANDTSELDALHEVGTKILDASSQDLYGASVTKEVAKRLGTYRQKIQFSIRLAQAYDSAAMDELREYKTKDETPYVWSSTHVRFLLRVKDEAQRASLAKECAEANWPSRKLQIEVNSLTSGDGPAKAAKGPGADLTSQLEGLLKFFNTWEDFVNLQSSAETNLYDKIAKLDNKLTEKQRSLVSQVMTRAPAFTEKVCELNGYVAQIKLPN